MILNPIYIYYLHVSNHKISSVHQFCEAWGCPPPLSSLSTDLYRTKWADHPAHSTNPHLLRGEPPKAAYRKVLWFLCVFLGDIIYARD